MLSNIIKVKLEKNSCPFEELEEFFASLKFGTKGFKDSSIKLVCQVLEDFTLILPREAVPNSFALKLLSLLSKGNELALPIILKYLSCRTVFKDFGQKLQAKMDQDIKEQNDSKISQEIELCKKDILNLLNGGKSVLDVQLKQRYKKYYSSIDNEIEELKTKILKELEDYISNTNVNKMYRSLNNKKKSEESLKEVALGSCSLGGICVLIFFSLGFFIFLATTIDPLAHMSMYKVKVFRCIGASPLVFVALELTVVGVAYLTSCYLNHSFTKEIQDYIEQPIKCMDKATNNKELDNFPSDNYEKVQPSAPLEELLPSYEESCYSSLGYIQPSNPIQQNKLL
ncbi:hypothetical protein [Wolbachia endosymbiont (group B) of Germaria angustata]|uniref:hypothetical protein n=1 Tax=Wolbachia endosymbiont (group B) of Germaria angustata TaxID=3077916 RepID=UPI0031332D8E